MKPTDRPKFAALLMSALEIYRESPSEGALAIWWAALERYEFDDIRAAFGAHVGSADGKFAPRPAHIIDRLAAQRPDGRPVADEAWAMIPKDEYGSVVWTSEMAEAFGIARMLVGSDDVGARMAFRAAYERIVSEARLRGDSVRWTVSLGWDRNGHAPALRDAVLRKRLRAEHAVQLLGPDQAEEFLVSVGANHLLPAPVDPAVAHEARRKLQLLISGIGKPVSTAGMRTPGANESTSDGAEIAGKPIVDPGSI